MVDGDSLIEDKTLALPERIIGINFLQGIQDATFQVINLI